MCRQIGRHLKHFHFAGRVRDEKRWRHYCLLLFDGDCIDTYRTLATSAHVSEIAIRLLMGHSLRGDVSFDYLTADLTWLRKAQEEISAYILEAAGLAADFRFAPDTFNSVKDAA